MNALFEYLLANPLYYITRDEERALGLDEKTEGYTIISNNDGDDKSTRELMNDLAEKSIVSGGAHVLVFKNTKAIERIADESTWMLLNPSAALANTIEEKVSQYEWLGDLVSLLPPTHVTTCRDLTWSEGKQYVVQFNHAHSGEGTQVITCQADVDALVSKFPDRPVRVSQFISGPIFTVNAVAHASGVLVSSPSYQITGLSPFTHNAFTTIGNDWGAANIMLTNEQRLEIDKLAMQVGNKMRVDGWKGLFGIDVVVEEGTGNVYLIEINARQPASTTYESQIQARTRREDNMITTFETHLSALMDIDLSGYELVPVTSGAQIIQRITDQTATVSDETVADIEALGCSVRRYRNEKMGSELLRIQLVESIVDKHNELTALGQSIESSLL